MKHAALAFLLAVGVFALALFIEPHYPNAFVHGLVNAAVIACGITPAGLINSVVA